MVREKRGRSRKCERKKQLSLSSLLSHRRLGGQRGLESAWRDLHPLRTMGNEGERERERERETHLGALGEELVKGGGRGDDSGGGRLFIELESERRIGREGATREASPALLAADREATGRTAEARTAMEDMVMRRWKVGEAEEEAGIEEEGKESRLKLCLEPWINPSSLSSCLFLLFSLSFLCK